MLEKKVRDHIYMKQNSGVKIAIKNTNNNTYNSLYRLLTTHYIDIDYYTHNNKYINNNAHHTNLINKK